MAELNLNLNKDVKTGWNLLSVVGRIDTTNAQEAEKGLLEVLSEEAGLALDFENLEYISSAGLRVLLRLAKSAKASNKNLRLINVHGFVKEVLEDSGMDVFFKICKSVDEL